MKKSLILFVGILSFFGINTVSADTYEATNFYDNFETYVNGYSTYKENIDYLINYWQDNYSSNYPYYAIVAANTINNTYENFGDRISLYYSNSNLVSYNLSYSSFMFSAENIQYNGHSAYSHISYLISSDTYEFYPAQDYDGSTVEYFTPPIIYTTNFNNPGFKLLLSNGLIYDNFDSEFDTILFPSYSSETLNISINEFEVFDGKIFPTIITLYDGSYITNELNNYVTINLNEYPYVALSLKDYTERDMFYTNVYVKGQYCLTPVYNYGMTEKKDIITGSKTQRCSTYYNDFTLVRTYILDQDIKNHAIYYLKAYDISKENIVKVDTSIFDITYITEETEDNPYVTVNGKDYPTISYNNLTDSATISEDEDYISGVTCQVGDFNCYSKYNPENIFDNIFSSPLDFLKDIWSSVTSIFNIITEFITLLPVEMQTFLYLSFMIAIILGLLKLIL